MGFKEKLVKLQANISFTCMPGIVSYDTNRGMAEFTFTPRNRGAYDKSGITVAYNEPTVPQHQSAPDQVPKSHLFTGGYCIPEITKLLHPQLTDARILTGDYYDYGDENRFIVSDDGLHSYDSHLLIFVEQKDVDFAEFFQDSEEIAVNMQYWHSFERSGTKYQIFVMDMEALPFKQSLSDGDIFSECDLAFLNAKLRLMPSVFEVPYMHDDIVYTNGWCIDRLGREIKPIAEKAEQGKPGIKIWECDDPSNVYLSVFTNTDGTISLYYQHSPYQMDQHPRSDAALTELQKRRMVTIRKQVIKIIQENLKDYYNNSDDPAVLGIPEWVELKEQYAN